jgi:hypothetical protein
MPLHEEGRLPTVIGRTAIRPPDVNKVDQTARSASDGKVSLLPQQALQKSASEEPTKAAQSSSSSPINRSSSSTSRGSSSAS